MAADDFAYVPGWAPDAVAMMSSRRAEDRAGAVLTRLRGTETVVDVGCGPGTITVGLAGRLASGGHVLGVDAQWSQVAAARSNAAGVGNARFAVAEAGALPCADRGVDVYFSHALFEHLADPAGALAEARRVLRPGGLLAVTASDWSRARFAPHTADIEAALQGHRLLRRRAGGDPDAGGRLRSWIDAAGFAVAEVRSRQLVDMGYAELAAYVGDRLADAGPLAAARRWQRTAGTWTQCWTEVVARKLSEERR